MTIVLIIMASCIIGLFASVIYLYDTMKNQFDLSNRLARAVNKYKEESSVKILYNNELVTCTIDSVYMNDYEIFIMLKFNDEYLKKYDMKHGHYNNFLQLRVNDFEELLVKD